MSTTTAATTPIRNVLDTLFFGLPDECAPILIGSDDIERHVSSGVELDGLLAEGGGVRALAQSGDLVSFVFLDTSDATPTEWKGLALEPTYVVANDRRQIAVYALVAATPSADVGELVAAMECDLRNAVPVAGVPGWSEVHFRECAYTDEALMAAFCPPPAAWPTAPQPLAVGDRYRDAQVMTPIDFTGGDPRLATPVAIARVANSRAKNWKSHKTTVCAVFQLLSSHETGAKDGLAYVFGEVEPGQRTQSNVISTHFVGIDIDNGLSGDELAKRVEKSGLMALVYSTHSHMKAETVLDHDELFRWMNREGFKSDEITLDAVKAKLAEKRYDPAVVASAAYCVKRVGAKNKVIVDHEPMQKWRIIIPLSEAYVIADNGKTHAEGRAKWAQIVRASADLLDVIVDEATLDVARLFYLPRHDEGAQFDAMLFGGDLLDWRKLDLKPLAHRSQTKRGGNGPATKKWAAQRADGFQLADLIREQAPERIRNEKATGIEIECPFAEEHSEPDDGTDTACFAANAGDGPGAGFVVTCRHNSCSGRDRLEFLNKMDADGWFEAGAIGDDRYDAADRSARPDSPRDRLERVAAALEATFPLPSSAFGTFEYRSYNGRLWAHKLEGTKEKGNWKPQFTPFYIQAGVAFADREGKRGLRVMIQDERLAMTTIDLEAGLAMKAHGAELRTRLRDMGVLMTEDGEKLILQLVKQTQPADPTMIYDRPGWRDGDFLTPWGTAIGANRPVELNAANCPSGEETAGTLEGWIEATKVAFDCGVLHFAVGVLAGFAGPIIDLCDYPTAWLAYTGSTTKGKSTAQKLSAAVWGTPKSKSGLFGSFNGTAKAAEALLERASGAGYHFDEHQMVDGRDMQTLIFTASGGGGTDRLSRDANLRKSRRWSLLATLSGEVSVFQKIKGTGAAVTTGLGARCLDLNVEDTPELSREVMDQINAVEHHYGHAGKVFVAAMFDAGYPTAPERLVREIDDKSARLIGPGSPVQRRAARIAAVIWQAGEIAQGCGLIPAEFDLEGMAQRLWAKALEADTAPGNSHEVAIRTLFESLISKKGVDIIEGLSPEHREAAGWYLDRHAAQVDAAWSNGVYIVRTSKLAELAGGALDRKAVVRALHERGFLVRNLRQDRGGWVWEYVKGLGKIQVVVIGADAVEGDLEETAPEVDRR